MPSSLSMLRRIVCCPARCTEISVPACSRTRTAMSNSSSFVWKLRMAIPVRYERQIDAFICADVDRVRLRLLAHLRIPDVHDVLARLDIAQRDFAVAADALEVRRVDDHDEGAHLVVDVAAEGDDAGFVEHDGIGGGSLFEGGVGTVFPPGRKNGKTGCRGNWENGPRGR